jgi:tetratricopeptide (TPR) repeat protein
MLAGEMAFAGGDVEGAIALLEIAKGVEDGLTYDEPEPWHIPVRQTLGPMLLAAGRPVEAQVAYEEALADHENSGWSLFGLEQALRAQGKNSEADEAKAAFREAWSRADIWLATSRF